MKLYILFNVKENFMHSFLPLYIYCLIIKENQLLQLYLQHVNNQDQGVKDHPNLLLHVLVHLALLNNDTW